MDVVEKEVLVAGGGKSGIAASAQLLIPMGKEVILYDGNGKSGCPDADRKGTGRGSGPAGSRKSGRDPGNGGRGQLCGPSGDFAADWEAELSLVVLSPGVAHRCCPLSRRLAMPTCPSGAR